MIAVARVTSKTVSVSPQARWSAVVARDNGADGRFVFAVTTTGVFCRPSCPARRPRPENVRFFATPQGAAEAGFRACRRCRPQLVGNPHAAWIARVCRRIEQANGRGVRLGDLGEAAGVSPDHLQRAFKRALGLSPREYAEAVRTQRLRKELRGGKTVTDATYEAGFGSMSRVYERSPARLGMSPATYGRGGRGMRIEYSIAPSALGRVLVATTERGICAVYLGDDDGSLERDLRAEYPAAEVRAASRGLDERVKEVLRAIEGDAQSTAFPLDVQATAFQWRVWRALQAIPSGETRSYGDIAKAIGAPRAARAVARACATNRVGVVIPCHRVVGSDGSLSGYRWGKGRKKKLLEREGGRT